VDAQYRAVPQAERHAGDIDEQIRTARKARIARPVACHLCANEADKIKACCTPLHA